MSNNEVLARGFVGLASSSVLSTIHLVLGIVLVMLNILVLLPVIKKAYFPKNSPITEKEKIRK